MMFRQKRTWWILAGALVALLLALNFLSFRVAQSKTETNHSLSTYRSGETLPDSMASGFRLWLVVDGQDQLAEALAQALQVELERNTAVDSVTIATDLPEPGAGPVLLVDLTSDRLWTPPYGRATLAAQVFFAYNGDAPWPLDEPVVFRVSPAVKADGEFTVEDTTWGLVSKPAYTEHLAQALAQDVAAALQGDAFRSG
ncbi:MAG: hypothetical protein PVH65_03180 [Chloroflexota bacterium]|jgi:hypothetical protein